MTLSPRMVAALNAEESDDQLVCLLTINHPNLTEPVRVTPLPIQKFDVDSYGIDSRGNRFHCIPFDFTLPSQNDDAIPTVKLQVENISREITASLKKITSPAVCMVEMVLDKYPDVVEQVWDDLMMRRAQGDILYVSADITADDITRERYPADTFSPSLYPGLY